MLLTAPAYFWNGWGLGDKRTGRFRKKFFVEYIFSVQLVIQHVTVRLAVAVAVWVLRATMHNTYSFIRFAQMLLSRLLWLDVRVVSGVIGL